VQQTIRVGVAQSVGPYMDKLACLEKASELIMDAGRLGIDLLNFPEGYIPGHPLWYYHHVASSPFAKSLALRLFENAIEIPGPEVDQLLEVASTAGVNVVIGCCERRKGHLGTLYNTQIFVGRDGLLAGRRQKLVPTVAGEREVHSLGVETGMRTFHFDIGAVGGLICGENSNPLAIQALINGGMVVQCAAWPSYFSPGISGGVGNIAELAGRALAYSAKSFVLSSCGAVTDTLLEQVGATDEEKAMLLGQESDGPSMIIGPSGDILARTRGVGEELIYADIQRSDIVSGKYIHDFSGHYQRFDVFTFSVRDDAE